MVTKLLLPSVIATVALLAYITPILRDTAALFNIFYDFSVNDAHLSSLIPTCALQHPDLFLGCEDMHLVNNTIYTACVTTDLNRGKYFPSTSRISRPYPGDKLFRWDLDSDTVVELELRGFPGADEAEARSFHGIDINVLPGGNVSIYAINHLRSSSVIDKFLHDPSTSYATHILRIPTTSQGAAKNPNAIFALPERDGDNAFFVTNDHRHDSGLFRDFEIFTRRPWAWVSFHSSTTGWKKVLTGLVGANGITGDKDPKRQRRIYVSEIMAGAIRVLELTPDGDGGLKQIQRIPVSMLGDNIGIYGSDLYIAGPAKALVSLPYLAAENPSAVDGPGMVVKRVNTLQLGDAFFGGGYTADPVVEELIMDGGKLANFTTTAAFRPYVKQSQEEGDEVIECEHQLERRSKGDLFFTGLRFKGIMKCSNFE